MVDDELLLHKSLLGKSDDFSFSDGYYHTGDIIEWINQEERLFKFKSRKNELINVGGYKVNPGEVENVILRMKFHLYRQKNGVELLALSTLFSGFSHRLWHGLDKTIAHTNLTISKAL